MIPELFFVLASLPGLGADTAPGLDAGPNRPMLSTDGFLELVRGRLTLAGESGTESFLGTTPEFSLADGGHMEMGATGRVVLRWAGQGSLCFTGSVTLEWNGSPFTGEPAALIDFDHVEVDVRKGELGLVLPGGVLLIAERAALELRSRSSGMFGVHHLGGSEATLIVPAPGQPVRHQLTPGQWIWIDPDEYLGRSRFEPILAEVLAPAPKPIKVLAQPATIEPAAKPTGIVLPPKQTATPKIEPSIPMQEPIEVPMALPPSIPLIEWVPFTLTEAELAKPAIQSPWQAQYETVLTRPQMDLSGYSLAPKPGPPLNLLKDFE